MAKNKMMVVEDTELDRVILNEIFNNLYDIDEFENGKDALESLDYPDKYDIVILDLMMPIMSGIEFLQFLREKFDQFKTPIIVITADNNLHIQKEVFMLGATDFIIKPFDPTVIFHRVNNAVLAYQRINEIEKVNKELEEKAYKDALTGVFNRGRGEELITEYLSKPSEKDFGLILFDIDNFKLVNDTEGHQEGDRVLQIIGELINSYFREYDVVSRFGGDEFVVLMRNMDSIKDVTIKVEDLNRLLRFNPNITIPANVTLSAGISYGKNKSFP